MKIRMKDNYGIEYDGVQPHHDPMGLWEWSVDHTDGAFAGTRVLFSAMVWEPVPEPIRRAIDAILIDRKGFQKCIQVDRVQLFVVIPVRVGPAFVEMRFERTAEVIDGKIVFRETKQVSATGGIVKADQ